MNFHPHQAEPVPIDEVEALFHAALELPSHEAREAMLRGRAADERLVAEVRVMLAALESAGNFMESGPRLLDEAGRDPMIGESIGPYKLVERLGEGGFGVVWVAEQEQPVRRRVAVKIIRFGMDTREGVTLFQQEMQALAAMDHPNIARIFDAGTTAQAQPYFVMELVRGVKITEHCDEHRLSLKARIELFITVCQAVQHAHQKGIIHRDLKPSNILVTAHHSVAVPKVIDFGVAKVTEGRLAEHPLDNQLQQRIGTPLYMSPEQAERATRDIDTRSDIYTLGVLLYELLTGCTPLDPAAAGLAEPSQVLRMVREGQTSLPSARLRLLPSDQLAAAADRRQSQSAKLCATLRGDLDAIAMKCLQKDRQLRYDTAIALAEDLRRYLDGKPVRARPLTTAYWTRCLVRRNKPAFAAGVTVAVSLIGGLAASLMQAERADREAFAARNEAARAQHESMRAAAALGELRSTAPAFAEQARQFADTARFEEAIRKLDYATRLRPDLPEYLVAKGDMLECALRFDEAATAYREALRLDPSHPRAKIHAELCEQIAKAKREPDGSHSRKRLASLHAEMQREHRAPAELLAIGSLLETEDQSIVAPWIARLRGLPLGNDQPLEKRIRVRPNRLLQLDLMKTDVVDLSPLEGMPIEFLDLRGCGHFKDLRPVAKLPDLRRLLLDDTIVSDLSPLQGLPLEYLTFAFTRVSDLSPLAGMKLRRIDLRHTRVTDLSPLAGMPLTQIYAAKIPARDFSPLAGMPLKDCQFEETAFGSLEILRGAPLERLALSHCTHVFDFAVLSTIPTLRMLGLPASYRTFPDAEYAAIAALRSHPGLTHLNADVTEGLLREKAEPKDVFWERWDREAGFVQRLRKAGASFKVRHRDDGLLEVTIEGESFRDLSPLAGSDIEILRLARTGVSDLFVLRALPLKVLDLTECPHLTDLSPLAGHPTLEALAIPNAPLDLAPLRTLPELTHLGYEMDEDADHPRTRAAKFWSDYDAGK